MTVTINEAMDTAHPMYDTTLRAARSLGGAPCKKTLTFRKKLLFQYT